MNDYLADQIRTAYRAAVARAAAAGTTIKEAADEVSTYLAERIREGSLEIAPEDYLPLLIRKADERDGAMADKVLEAYTFGQAELIDEATLDVVVTLGAGKRKTMRNVTSDDLMAMDDLRYRNVRAAEDAYDEWRRYFSVARRVLAGYPTMGDAVAAGAFDALVSAA